MPKPGFKSLTIPESVYNNIKKDYESQKQLLKKQGIFGLGGYLAYIYYQNRNIPQ